MVEIREAKIPELMAAFEQVCRSQGLRATHQRSEIFRELITYPGHPTADNVFSRVRKRLKTISLDTVYRTIALFEKHGLIKRVQLIDNSVRFDTNLSVHHHMVCTNCKAIEDFYWPDFDNMKLPDSIEEWGDASSKHAEIHGLCRKCKKALGQ
jgi:Fur family peroxide stress response transcriptional regulator